MSMTPTQLETHLAGAREADALEFKQAMAWDKAVFVKDILALSNVVDGGLIIVGVEDGTFERQGLNSNQLSTYDIDIMRDQIAPYATPRAEFDLQFVQDLSGLTFAVIEVRPFEELPVICAKSGSDVKRGEMYFRSRAARPASERISRSEDMREIVETAISRRLAKLQRIGLVPVGGPSIDYDSELGGL